MRYERVSTITSDPGNAFIVAAVDQNAIVGELKLPHVHGTIFLPSYSTLARIFDLVELRLPESDRPQLVYVERAYEPTLLALLRQMGACDKPVELAPWN